MSHGLDGERAAQERRHHWALGHFSVHGTSGGSRRDTGMHGGKGLHAGENRRLTRSVANRPPYQLPEQLVCRIAAHVGSSVKISFPGSHDDNWRLGGHETTVAALGSKTNWQPARFLNLRWITALLPPTAHPMAHGVGVMSELQQGGDHACKVPSANDCLQASRASLL